MNDAFAESVEKTFCSFKQVVFVNLNELGISTR